MSVRTFLSATAALLFLFSVTGFAQEPGVPYTMHYQGQLTDAFGDPVPDGVYSFRPQLYDAATGGSAKYNSSNIAVSVTVENGLFELTLGESPLPPLYPSNLNGATAGDIWLQLRVGSDSPLSPRTKLTSVPFSLVTGSIDGASAGTVKGTLSVDDESDGIPEVAIYGGDTGDDGRIWMYGEGAFRVLIDSDNYGSMLMWNPASTSYNVEMYAGSDGGTLNLWDSDPSGFNDIALRAGIDGPSAATLPANAIEAYEIEDEPGVAREQRTGGTLLSSSWQVLDSVTLTVPDEGYVVVLGMVYGEVSATNGYNLGFVQITDWDGSSGAQPPYTQVFGHVDAPNTSPVYYPVSCQRLFQASAASNPQAYYLMAAASPSNSAGAQTRVWDPSLIAMYFTTSYGTAKAIYSSGRVPPGLEATPVQADDRGVFDVPNDLVEVDLRELELRAAKARQEALRAEMELLKAQREASTPSSPNER
ncbi:hypothetical protein GF420_09800 [candidate division GN15 bacterium]|nr:hypothetical protein [candidate division GN15 bacterium]